MSAPSLFRLARPPFLVFGLLAAVLVARPAPVFAASFQDRLMAEAAAMDQEAARLERLADAPLSPIGPGPLLHEGESGPRVTRLIARLVADGFLKPGFTGETFDGAVAAAVTAFQTRQGLDEDGDVGSATEAALDLDRDARVRALQLTARRIRELVAKEPSSEFILVNVPAERVLAVKDGAVVLDMRAAVGRPDRRTPLMDDEAVDVILNPTWTVPASIIRKEEMPQFRASGWTDVQNARVYVDGRRVARGEVDWASTAPDRVRIVQAPGDANALGRIKIELTNGFSVYMHGTAEAAKLLKDERDISHGCIRLQQPRQMADLLLEGAGWPDARIDAALASLRTEWIKLPRRVPVHVVYWTAAEGGAGRFLFYPDIYGYDATSAAAAR